MVGRLGASDSLMSYIANILGSSLVTKRESLVNEAKSRGRTNSTVRNILYILRRRRLIYDWKEYVINVPLLLTHIYFDDVMAVEELVKMGLDREDAKRVVSDVHEKFRDDFSDFIEMFTDYYKARETLIAQLKKEKVPTSSNISRNLLEEIEEIFRLSLGLLLAEAKTLAERLWLYACRNEAALSRLQRELAGFRFFAEHLARLPVDDDTLDRLRDMHASLVLKITRLSRDENHQFEYYSRVFLERVFWVILTNILPQYHVTLVFYKAKPKSRRNMRKR